MIFHFFHNEKKFTDTFQLCCKESRVMMHNVNNTFPIILVILRLLNTFRPLYFPVMYLGKYCSRV